MVILNYIYFGVFILMCLLFPSLPKTGFILLFLIKWWVIGYIGRKLWILYSTRAWGKLNYSDLNPLPLQWNTTNPFLFIFTYISLRIFLSSYALLKRFLTYWTDNIQTPQSRSSTIRIIFVSLGALGVVWVFGAPWVVCTALIQIIKNLSRCTPLWALYEEAVMMEWRAKNLRICFYGSFFVFNPKQLPEWAIKTYKNLSPPLKSHLHKTITSAENELVNLNYQKSLSIASRSFKPRLVRHPSIEDGAGTAAVGRNFFNLSNDLTLLGGTHPIGSYQAYSLIGRADWRGEFGGITNAFEQRTAFLQVNYSSPPATLYPSDGRFIISRFGLETNLYLFNKAIVEAGSVRVFHDQTKQQIPLSEEDYSQFDLTPYGAERCAVLDATYGFQTMSIDEIANFARLRTGILCSPNPTETWAMLDELNYL